MAEKMEKPERIKVEYKKEEMKQDEYVQAVMPDRVAIKRLIEAAKGPNRTMKEFAEACSTYCKGTSASTFSRIVNGKGKKGLSLDLIKAVAANSVDKDTVTIDALMKANGFLTEREYDRQYRAARFSEEKAMRKKKVRDIIQDKLFEENYVLKSFPPGFELKDEKRLSKHGLRSLRGNYSVYSFFLGIDGGKPEYWLFIAEMTGFEKDANYYAHSDGKCDVKSFLVYEISDLFLRDVWEPETLEGIKTTFIFFTEESYEDFLKLIDGIKVNSWMSVLWVDMEKGRVVEEHQLPTMTKKPYSNDPGIFPQQ